MKIAIVADIHANWDAFEPVIKHMKALKVDLLFSLGDQIGYYYDAPQIFEEISLWDHFMISGNHERIFTQFQEGTDDFRETITSKYGKCFMQYEGAFDPLLKQRVSGLDVSKELELDGLKFLLCHGAPDNEDMYIYPDADLKVLEKYMDLDYDFVLAGHTHYPMVRNLNNGLFVNPGSVGQCRIQGGVARWGIIDTKNKVYVPKETHYDVSKLVERMTQLEGENSYHVKVLKRKRF
ncbi:MAG: metallophosphatase family protein [Flavobacteriales bacterium]|nr:metallophosphatase family protein [Flavobacteriales bacterium]